MFMMLRWLSIFLVSMLALTTLWGCSGAGSSSAVPLQGIRGTTTLRLNPGIPGPPPIVSPLPNAVITVQSNSGAEVGRQTSNANGNFEIRLPVGTYTIVPLLPNPNNSPVTALPPTQNVVVQAGQFTTVNLEYRSDAP